MILFSLDYTIRYVAALISFLAKILYKKLIRR